MVRLEAQTSQIQQYQEMETNSCIEKSDLREELKQAREKIEFLEAKTKSTANMEGPPEPVSRNIVPFAAIADKLSPPRAMSTFDDPADFAMLLESEEFLAPAISPKVTSPPEDLERTAVAANKEKVESSTRGDDFTFDIPENLDQPQFTKKRKAVNFRETYPEALEPETGDSQQDTGSGVQTQEERPNKSSRHVQKWTYSRVRTTSTEIQQERSTGPKVATRGHRQTSPKNLISASSSSVANPRANTRSRGKRRSRGTVPLELDANLNVAVVLTSGRRTLQCAFQPGWLISAFYQTRQSPALSELSLSVQ